LRKLLVAVGVFGSLGLAGSALAKPWDDHASPPPGTLRPEVQMKLAADGRADLQVDHSSRPAPYAQNAAKPAPDRSYGQMSHGAPVQLKAEIALKMQRDDREGSGAAAAKRPDVGQTAHVDNSFGRAKPAPAIPLKMDIQMKMQKGDNRESSDSRSALSKPADRDSQKAGGLKKPMSRESKLALCKQTGVCIPMLSASDDSDDKTM
jgi:hypothetical protein